MVVLLTEDRSDDMAPIRSPCSLEQILSTGGHQLIRHGRPFLVLGGELFNSSMTSASYMSMQWNNLKDQGLNTVLGAVTWEQIESEQGIFDFGELDRCIFDCRASGMHLIVLWFGSFKNGESRTPVPNSVSDGTVTFDSARARRGVVLHSFLDEGSTRPISPSARRERTWCSRAEERALGLSSCQYGSRCHRLRQPRPAYCCHRQ